MSVLRCIMIKLLKTKDKEKILNTAKEKWYIAYRGTLVWMIVDFWSESMDSEGSVIHFSSTEREEPSTLNSITSKYSSGINTLSDEGKLREFVTSKPTVKEMLKEVLVK